MPKRKASWLATDNSLFDKDEIRVAAPTRMRRVLDDVPVDAAQNKRRRIVECVAIRPVNRETRKLFNDAQFMFKNNASSASRPRRGISSFSRTPSDSGELELSGSAPVSPQQAEHSPAASAAQDCRSPGVAPRPIIESSAASPEMDGGRPRRSAARRSYAFEIDIEEDSADELSFAGGALRRKGTKATRKPTRLPCPASSDYEDISVPASEDDYEEPVVSESDPETSAAESEVEVELVRKARPKPPAKPRTDSSGEDAAPAKSASKKMSREMLNLLGSKGLDLSLPPLHEIDEIFSDLVQRALPIGLENAAHALQGKRIRAATMCSGTESPLLALQMISDALKAASGLSLEVDHLFSAEIEPYKQAYIARNFNPPTIFRDIREPTDAPQSGRPMATTAYGAKVAVPREVDLLIAGTSCVDYSRMNKKNQDMETAEVGESGDTWRAVLAYCKRFRPAIVILENVRTAPWDNLLRDYKDIGYEAAGAYVDTKNFYIPQTRQRGYQVCFDKSKLQDAGIKSATDDWKRTMTSLQRRASSPVSDFLLPTDQVAMRPLQITENAQDRDWSKCETRHTSYRLKQRLGVSRPITRWLENGTVLPPDHSFRPWFQSQVERVLDCIDAAFLRRLRDGVDARFKTDVLDISQNVDRLVKTGRGGLIGCITPTGMSYNTDDARLLTGEESILLQGLPLRKISLTTETNAEIQNLAGNAMSCPVVGSAIIGALVGGSGLFTAVSTPAQEEHLAVERGPQLVATGLVDARVESRTPELAVCQLQELATRAQRRCHCEGSHGLAEHGIQRCGACGHTTCVACGGNPEHAYVQSQVLTAGRSTMAAFEEKIRHLLPLQLRLTGVPELTAKAPLAGYPKMMRLLQSTVFSFSSIRRTHCIRVEYTAPTGRLELCLSENEMIWNLFVNPPKDLRSNDPLRTSLSNPVARAQIGQSLLDLSWEWRQPVEKTSRVTIRESKERLPGRRARLQMPEFKTETQPRSLEIEVAAGGPNVRGTYQYLSRCGTAMDSLYKRIDPEGSNPLYLFLAPYRVGQGEDDCFVFSPSHAKLGHQEVRHIVATVHSSWRPWNLASDITDVPIGHAQWQHANTTLSAVSNDVVLHRPDNLALAPKSLSCSDTLLVMSATTDDAGWLLESHRPHHGFVDLDDRRFFSKSAWIFEAMRRQLSTDQWIEMPGPGRARRCFECAPERPALKWELSNMKAGQISSYEDPYAAVMYERAIKTQQHPLLVRVSDNSLDFGVNLHTLAHRAHSRLPGLDEEPSYRWRLTTSHSIADPTGQKFRITATDGVEPSEEDVQMSVQLFPKQRLALSWMREQEAGKSAVLEEAEEASLPVLGWRVELRAQTTKLVKGGICADHPGFGKTITSLALVHSEWLQEGPSALRTALSRNGAEELILSSATLIICPSVLAEQWAEEAREKWRSAEGIRVVKTVQDLAKHSAESFKTAKLIVVSKQVLAHKKYTEQLAAFAAMPGPAAEKGRAYAVWLKRAIAEVPEHLNILQQSGRSALVKHLAPKYEKRIRSSEFQVFVPSKRYKGQAYIEDQKKKKKAAAKKEAKSLEAPPTLQTNLVGPPLFEMFRFNRIIVDEFHELDAKELEVINALKAEKRWGLSGTPALGDCYDVAQIARLLNVPLRIGSLQPGLMKQINISRSRNQMTSFERFEAARLAPSVLQNGRIWELAQQFLDTFARRNVMDFDELSVQQHLVPVHLSVGHFATYHELSQHLNSADMKIRKSTKSEKTDRQKQFDAAIEESRTAEEALSRSAAFPQRSDLSAGAQATSTLDSWIEKREAELGSILKDLRAPLAKAFKEETGEYLTWRTARIDGNELKDEETCTLVREMCRQIDGGKTSASLPGMTKASSEIVGPRESTSIANKLVDRLRISQRSTRYLRNVQALQRLDLGSKGPKKCDDPGCRSKLNLNTAVAVSGLCGHLVCKDCLERTRARNLATCCAEGCGENVAPHHLLWNHKLGPAIRSTAHFPHGAKIDAAMDILARVRNQGEQAVMFVQYESEVKEMKNALAERAIPGVILRDSKDADTAKRVAEFKDPKQRKTVIVLNASAESAAGLNLQCANHVLFLSPLLRDTQYAYESTMAQAIGRVRRHGQGKPIHVYRLLALNTIDVDILEHRERRLDALTEENAQAISPPQALQDLDMHAVAPEREHTQLVCEDGKFSLRPKSWLVRCETSGAVGDDSRVRGGRRMSGWEDYSSLVKFSRGFVEDDD